jgi:hypothetical protein
MLFLRVKLVVSLTQNCRRPSPINEAQVIAPAFPVKPTGLAVNRWVCIGPRHIHHGG